MRVGSGRARIWAGEGKSSAHGVGEGRVGSCFSGMSEGKKRWTLGYMVQTRDQG